MDRLPLENAEARPDEFLEAEILRDLEGVLGFMEHLNPIRGKDPALVPYVAAADQVKGPEYVSTGSIGDEAVALALYCFLRYPDRYEKTVIRGANTNGDSDSIASIAGSISGAYFGIDAIPND